ncbi:MAG: hypothetical protein SVY53_08925 [Chloroflexota bacterium]|nr:hypothetical protein [Chloroflexota bacterium]
MNYKTAGDSAFSEPCCGEDIGVEMGVRSDDFVSSEVKGGWLNCPTIIRGAMPQKEQDTPMNTSLIRIVGSVGCATHRICYFYDSV